MRSAQVGRWYAPSTEWRSARYGVNPPTTVPAQKLFCDRGSRPPIALTSSNVMSITLPGLFAPVMAAYQPAPTRAEPGCRVRSSWRSVSDVMMIGCNLVKTCLETTNRAADGRLDAFGHRGSRRPCVWHGRTTVTHRDATPRAPSLRRNQRVVKCGAECCASRRAHEPGSSHTMPASGSMSNLRGPGFARHA
jgi:hypothetical protein